MMTIIWAGEQVLQLVPRHQGWQRVLAILDHSHAQEDPWFSLSYSICPWCQLWYSPGVSGTCCHAGQLQPPASALNSHHQPKTRVMQLATSLAHLLLYGRALQGLLQKQESEA